MGYGMSAGQLAHRVAWKLTYGPIPEGLFVCHACDTPACVNPFHLLLGSQQANLTDAQRKGRIRNGEAHRDAKLTAELAALIRAARVRGVAYKNLAVQFGVAIGTIQAIVDGRTWKPTGRFEGE